MTETKTVYTFQTPRHQYEQSSLAVSFHTNSDGQMWWKLHRQYAWSDVEDVMSLDLDEADFLIRVLTQRTHPTPEQREQPDADAR